MMRHPSSSMFFVLCSLSFVLNAANASAQGAKFVVSAGAAAQPTTASFADITTFPYFQETARTEGVYDVGTGVAFDVSALERVWRSLYVGFGVTHVNRDADSEVTASFPHPFFFNTNRTATVTNGALDRRETGVHVTAAWQFVDTSHLSATIFGGPSGFKYRQQVIEDVDVVQAYPYDTIDLQVSTGALDGWAVGFHVGADIGWFFSQHVGVGGLVRYTAAKKEVQVGSGQPFDLDIGGFQGGGGLRLRF